MSGSRFIVGDVFDVLATLPDGSVDLALTSPPFLAQRNYLPADHPRKNRELGSDPSPGAYVDTLLDVTEQLARVLAPHGSLCVEIGDTYSGSGGAGGDYNDNGWRDGQPRYDGSGRRGRDGDGWPLPKSLCLVPELYRLALVYGVNPLTGRTTPTWRVRNVARWCRPNPPPGHLSDKVRPATTDLVIACKSDRRYFDLDAVRHVNNDDAPRNHNKDHAAQHPRTGWTNDRPVIEQNPAGAPPLDHWWHDDVYPQDAWHIATEPYKGAHYATWPEQLVELPVEAMVPHRVCTTCGQPSTRITEVDYRPHGRKNPRESRLLGIDERTNPSAQGFEHGRADKLARTVGWSDCGHGTWRNGVVLDPFAGSGTTLAVAVGHGRDAIGIDLDDRNAELTRMRCGMFVAIDEARI